MLKNSPTNETLENTKQVFSAIAANGERQKEKIDHIQSEYDKVKERIRTLKNNVPTERKRKIESNEVTDILSDWSKRGKINNFNTSTSNYTEPIPLSYTRSVTTTTEVSKKPPRPISDPLLRKSSSIDPSGTEDFMRNFGSTSAMKGIYESIMGL